MTVTTSGRTRSYALSAAALAALVTLTGCASATEPSGDDTATSAESGAGDSLLPPAEGTTQYPLTLTTWAGESVLEERPERIAVIGFSPNLDALEAIGATPVYTLSDTAWEWNDQDWVSQIELVDTATRRDPLNVEGIASTNPDLIVAVNFIWDENDYEKLTDIAPVLENPVQVEGDQIDWRETQRLIGEALDLADAAEQAIADAEQAIADVADAHPEWAGRTVTVAYDYTESGMDYYTVTGGTAEDMFTRLGFAPNPLAEEFVDEAGVSDERVSALDADALIVFYDDTATQEARESGALFQALPPVVDGRYVAVNFEGGSPDASASWVLRRGASALSLPWTADVIAGWLDQVDLS